MFSLWRLFIFFVIMLQVTSSQDELNKLPQPQDAKTTIGDDEGSERVPRPQLRELSSYRGLRSFNCMQCYSMHNRDQTRPSSIGHHRRSNRDEVLPSTSFSRRSGGGGGGGGGSKGGGGRSGSSKGAGSGGKKSGGKTSTGTSSNSAQSVHQSSGDHNMASHLCNYLFPFFMTSLLML